jgi:spore germination protein
MKRLLLFSTCCLLLSGCIEKEIIDELQLIFAVAYDKGEDGKIEATVSTPIFTKDQDVQSETYTNSAYTSKGFRAKVNAETPRPIVSGKVMAAIFSKELAKTGIQDFIDTFQRDPSIGRQVYLAISEEEAGKLLEPKYETKDSVGMYLANLIEQNIKYHTLPETNLHKFLYQYYGEGIDPYLPLIGEHNDHNHIIIKGLALFNGSKYVDHIESDYLLTFQAMEGKFKSGNYELRLENDESAAIFPMDSDVAFNVNKENKVPEINVTVTMEGAISEFSGTKLTKEKVKEIETTLQKKIEQQAKTLLKKFQELEVDPLGLGHIVKGKTRNWKEKEWKEIYPTIKINTTVKIKIIESGVVQ